MDDPPKNRKATAPHRRAGSTCTLLLTRSSSWRVYAQEIGGCQCVVVGFSPDARRGTDLGGRATGDLAARSATVADGERRDLTWIDQMVHPNITFWDVDQPGPQNKESLARWNRYSSAASTVLEQELF